MIKNKKGFTLIEILLVISLFSIFSLISVSINKKIYDEVLLETTANEVKSGILLAQQLSRDQGCYYDFDIINHNCVMQVREAKNGGKVIFENKLKPQIKVIPSDFRKIVYDMNGITVYHEFYLTNQSNKKIKIQTMIGTGSVKVSKMY
ncbi:type II secretion system protein [Marinisporobacter balticus]|uniref:type II secretion system protein n=1 Tax=Marinisporobacter balticus TaxID=2018667 RepID=UPI00140447AF|nr:type II secretion system protein [Marinisporobacter balticus]